MDRSSDRRQEPVAPAKARPQGERLQKVLAAAGFGSRRHCEEYITTGRVTIDGKVADSLGVRVDADTQKIAVDGERLKIHAKKYFLLHKPKGCLCTNADPAGRTRVVDLLPPMEARLFSVGRLDENTEGLLLVTNDGELAHRLAHPRFQVERIYRVLVAGHPTEELLKQLQDGIFFTEGKFRVRQVRRIKTHGQSTLLEVVITEGQNREVRRLFARIGHKVMSLQRVQFGPLRLGDLAPAEFRPLRPQELDRLRELLANGGSRPHKPPRPGKSPSGRRPQASDQRPSRSPRQGRPGSRNEAGEFQEPRPFRPASRPARPDRPDRPAARPDERARPERRPPTDRPGATSRPRNAAPKGLKKVMRKRPPRQR